MIPLRDLAKRLAHDHTTGPTGKCRVCWEFWPCSLVTFTNRVDYLERAALVALEWVAGFPLQGSASASDINARDRVYEALYAQLYGPPQPAPGAK